MTVGALVPAIPQCCRESHQEQPCWWAFEPVAHLGVFSKLVRFVNLARKLGLVAESV
jgi:hypothetical protein